MSMFTQAEKLEKVFQNFAMEPSGTGLVYIYDRESEKKIKSFKSKKLAAKWCINEAVKILLKEKQHGMS